MKRKIILLLLFLLLLVSACTRRGKSGVVADVGLEFHDVVRIKTTPVKSQGSSELCWIYGMLATIESERLMLGDSVNLSVDYLARPLLMEEALRCYFSKEGTVRMRGMASRALTLLQRYGAMPYESYHYGGTEGMERAASYKALARAATQMARACTSVDMLREKLDRMLDERVDYLPRVVFMLGAEYTPLEFAHSVCMPGDWEALTSFSHEPFYRRMVLESEDNVMRDSFLNVPLDTMMARLDRSLLAGHPACWEGDVSEPGFDWANGRATLRREDRPVDQARRQRSYEHRKTTDDHVMEVCGLARDGKGRKYYKLKNSWGAGNRYHGFVYLSEAYMRQKTIAIIVKSQP